LQVRPLLVVSEAGEQNPDFTQDFPDHPLLIENGKCAAGGVVAGRVLVTDSRRVEDDLRRMGPNTILVTPTASTLLTPWIGQVKGIITDIGSIASHLASVSREFGVPALFDTQNATATLKDGEEITLWASQSKVYRGIVEERESRWRAVFHRGDL
jgi:pyruvate,water dikinase